MAILINDNTARVQYTATSGQTTFAVPFEFFENSDLKVYRNSTLQTITTHYTLTGAGVTGGGNLTFVSGVTLNDIITILRDISIKRVTDFPLSGPFNITALNLQLDQLTAMIQEVNTLVTTRVPLLSEFDRPSTFSAIPTLANRANRYFYWDANGNPAATLNPIFPTNYLALDRGTAADPTYTFFGDLDTGMWSPTANTIAFSTTGIEAMRINPGVIDLETGDTPGSLVVNSTLQVASSASIGATAISTGSVEIGKAFTSSVSTYLAFHSGGVSGFADARFVRNSTANGNLDLINNGTGDITISANGSERMRVASNGNVGIGTANPNVKLEVSSATGSAPPTPTEVRISTTTVASDYSTTLPWGRLSFYSADISDGGVAKIQGTIDAIADAAAGGRMAMVFSTSVVTTGALTERMRLSSDGSITLITNQTTGIWTAGGTSGTGAITLGQSTVSQTTNIQAGATASGSTKTINLGTGGLTGSTTAITIGSTLGSTTSGQGSWSFTAGATTSVFTVGVTNGTGIITLGQSTASQTTNIQAGITASGSTKTINIGTNGASGSTTNINIGSATSGANQTTTISGNVGIGTSNPTSKLDVVGNANFGASIITGTGVSTGDVQLELGANRSGNGLAYVDLHSAAGTDFEARLIRYAGANGGMDIIQTGTGGMVITNEGNADTAFKTNALERMRIDNSGNVGIGTNLTSTYGKFAVAGTGVVLSNIVGDNTGEGQLIYHNVTAGRISVAGAFPLIFQTNSNERFRITSTGGIISSDLSDAVGYKGLPQNSQAASYTLALSDMGKHISITTGGVVIPPNSGGGSVAFPIGTTIVIYNNSGTAQNISITTDTLRLAGTATTGTRSLAQRGLATCVKVLATEWVVSGNVT